MPRVLSYKMLREIIERRMQETDRARQQAVRPAVTVIRSTGSGAMTIAQELADFLNTLKGAEQSPWMALDQNLVNRVLEDHRLPEKLSEYFPEDKFSTIGDLVGEVMGLHPSRWTLVQKTTVTVLRLCRMGHVIIVGRGANIMARGLPNVLHVRLLGSERKRIARVMTELGMNREQAEEHVRSTDRSRAAFVKQHFGKSVDDALLYHVTINTDLLSDAEVVRMIGGAIQDWPVRRSQQAAA